MPGELERATIAVVREVYGGSLLPTPDWLQRPDRRDCGRRWRVAGRIYSELTGLELPEAMPAPRVAHR